MHPLAAPISACSRDANSTGVRGIKAFRWRRSGEPSLLRHGDGSAAEARAYLRQASAARKAQGESLGDDAELSAEDAAEEPKRGRKSVLSTERYAELGAREQFVLAASEQGFGKRTQFLDIA